MALVNKGGGDFLEAVPGPAFDHQDRAGKVAFMNGFTSFSGNGDFLALSPCLFSLGKFDGKETVFKGCLDLFQVDAPGQRNHPVEGAVGPFQMVIVLSFVLLFLFLFTFNGYGIIGNKNFHILFIDPGDFGLDCESFITFMYIDGGRKTGITTFPCPDRFEIEATEEIIKEVVHFPLQRIKGMVLLTS